MSIAQHPEVAPPAGNAAAPRTVSAGPGYGHAEMAAALAAESANPIAAYALDRDKALFGDAEGVVPYAVRAGVALAAGEPLCPPERRLAVAEAFMHHCRARGWIPAFYQVLDRGVDDYRAVGLLALKIGEEAMIDLPSFSLQGAPIANVRHCVAHCERDELRAEIHLHGVADETTLDGLESVSAAWLAAEPGRGEMGFSMGSFSRAAMRTACVALARDGTGSIRAFVTFRPFGQPEHRGMVLDLMRHDAAAPAGTIDFLIARALEYFRDRGYRSASLSLAPLAGVAGDGRNRLAERLLGLLYEKGIGIYRYKSLYTFKRKFVPRWESRYLLYPGGHLSLLRVGLAVALVHRPR
jgi:phosphatidylglycerol lysyltransferase